MKVFYEIDWYTFDFYGRAKENVEELSKEEFENVCNVIDNMQKNEEDFVEIDEVEINDIFCDDDFIESIIERPLN